MRFSLNKSYEVTARGKNGKHIASSNDSFENKGAVLYRAKYLAEQAHRTLVEVKVKSEDEYAVYTPSGRKLYGGCL